MTTTTAERVKLNESWRPYLLTEFDQPYMQQLRQFLLSEKQKNKILFPKSAEIFNAFEYTPFEQVKVVMLGQDPYHGPGQAHGLCFSVQPGIEIPPSLRNIYQEIHNDLAIAPARHGNLVAWAKQGVLLLNSVLTVVQGQAAAHQGKGWEQFTDAVINTLSYTKENLVFILWGRYAQEKGKIIDISKHLIIQSAHPSPFSAYSGFFGSKPFSKANNYLESHGLMPIVW